MRVATLLRRFPWLASLLVACGDGTAVGSGGGTDSSVGPDAAAIAVDDVIFTAQNVSVALDTASGLLGNDTDPDGGPLTVTEFDAISAAGATVVVADDGAVTYDPASGFWGPDSFEYTIEDDTGETATATVTVYVAPSRIPLADVAAGMGGFALKGEAGLSNSGYSVSGAGDVNGDGLDDIIVGAAFADPDGIAGLSGRSYVVFGKADTAVVELSAVAAGLGGFVLDGESNSDRSGSSVSGVGDVNGDGLDDIIVGAPLAGFGTAQGRSYVVFGKADTAAVGLGAIAAGMGGFVLNGEPGSRSGWSVSGAGDVNGDGIDDIIVGTDRVNPNAMLGADAGRCYVVFGKSDTAAVELSAVTQGLGGFVLGAELTGDSSGRKVSGAGDVNGDGLDDIIVGLYSADPNGSYSGRSYVVFGKADTDAVDLSNIAEGMGGFALDGEAAQDRLGASVSGAGDVNGDGMDDIIVGARFADPNGSASGRSYVVFGKSDLEAVDLSAISAGLGGFVLNGEAEEDDAGGSVSGAGDVNGDGRDDIIVGARTADPNGFDSGRSYLVFGKTDTDAIQLGAIAAGVGGFMLDGEAADDHSGHAVSGVGDVNGDGMDDIIVGTAFAMLYPDPQGRQGRSYVVFGVPTDDN